MRHPLKQSSWSPVLMFLVAAAGLLVGSAPAQGVVAAPEPRPDVTATRTVTARGDGDHAPRKGSVPGRVHHRSTHQ